MTPIY